MNIITEKETTLPSLRNQDWKNVKVKTDTVNRLLTNIPTGSISELNKLIYTEAKVVCDKIIIPQRKLNKNTKPGWEIRLEGQIKKLRQQAKMLKKILKKLTKIYWDEKTKTKQQTSLKIQLGEINQKILAKEGILKRYWDTIKQRKQNRTFQNKERKVSQVSKKNARKQTIKKTKQFWSKIWKQRT